MHAFYDLYKLGDHGSAMWMGRVHSYDVALLEIELSAAKAPGDYLIVNEQSGEQNVLSFGLRLDGHVKSMGRGQVTVNAKSISGGPDTSATRKVPVGTNFSTDARSTLWRK